MAVLKGPTLQLDQHLAATSAGSLLISFFASTLPVVQWVAALVAIITGAIVIIGKFRNKK